MVIKLVRIDIPDPSKIQVKIGKHIIGRGKFLHNDDTDKRVSRSHAEIEITPDNITLKSLHLNPCFYIKKDTQETELLSQNCEISLYNGDKFGILPKSFWYEIIHVPDTNGSDLPLDTEQQSTEEYEINLQEPSNNESTIPNGMNSPMRTTDSPQDKTSTDTHIPVKQSGNPQDQNSIDTPIHSTNDPMRGTVPTVQDRIYPDENAEMERTTQEPPPDQNSTDVQNTIEATVSPQDGTSPDTDTAMERSGSPQDRNMSDEDSLMGSGSPLDRDFPDIKATIKRSDSPQDTTSTDTNTSVKRSHSPQNDIDVKKIKTEPDDAGNATPGPSNRQSSSDSGNRDMPGSPAKPANNVLLRERCIYGANCYRRNPQHKAQFSHPADGDWGAGERGACPWGASCRRADPRHWAAHRHPPGVLPPDPNARPGKKRKPKKEKESSGSEDETPTADLIVTGKRIRKTINREMWSESEDSDPYRTDGSDEWQPPSNVTSSQDYTGDF